MAQILIIEDNATMREGIGQILTKVGHETRAASGGKEGVRLFEEHQPDFVITDLKMEDLDGIEVLRQIRQNAPEALVMIITAFGTIETAVEAMKLGAFDFITKPFSPDLLRLKVSKALNVVHMRAENEYLRSEDRRNHPDAMVGVSQELEDIREQIFRVSQTDSTVLITGESGTGKELVARAVHARSSRAGKPFIKVDCSALAEGVLESELFGHERGAFTGAAQRKLGRFELADGGTLFLDEIGDISPAVQLKLLRVLQDRSFERVGGTRTVNVDVRVISATNKDLSAEIKKGRFREDLYYRLHIVPIHVPPLRKRKKDVPLLLDHFLSLFSRKTGRNLHLTPEAADALKNHQWPGNIRELENLMERLSVLVRHSEIGLSDLPESFRKMSPQVNLEVGEQDLDLNQSLEQLEKQLIEEAYRRAGGVKTRTAELLKIKPSALYYKLEKYGIYTKD